MAVTLRDVRSLLASEEPRYEEGAKLGPDAIPHLAKLVRDKDPLLASKAAYLASLIDAEGAADVVSAAAGSHEPTVRVAAAAAAQNLSAKAASDVLASLADDDDDGVRKTVRRSRSGDIGTIETTNTARVSGAAGTLSIMADASWKVDATGSGGGSELTSATELMQKRGTMGSTGEGGGSTDGGGGKLGGDRPLGAGDGGGSIDGVNSARGGVSAASGIGDGGGDIPTRDGRIGTGNLPDSSSMGGRAPAGDGGGRY